VRPRDLPVDFATPNAARLYDYFLGGASNSSIDRELAHRISEAAPDTHGYVRSNRNFLRRAVRYMVGEGITQFLDIGSGIPTLGNVHEVARIVTPWVRVLYVDNNESAVNHSNTILNGDPNVLAVQADLRTPDHVLGKAAEFLDFSRPIGLLTVGVLHFIPDSDDPQALLAKYHAVLPAGSCHALSHATGDFDAEQMAAAIAAYEKDNDRQERVFARTLEEVAALMGSDLEMVEPGVVSTELWRPDGPRTSTSGAYAALAHKP
jgi:hypothetical protein